MLIPCPECDAQVSDRARACPHCGFPVAEELLRALADVTGADQTKSARQISAAAKLKTWSDRYVGTEEPKAHPKTLGGRRALRERYKHVLLIAAVLIIVILQVLIVFSAAYR